MNDDNPRTDPAQQAAPDQGTDPRDSGAPQDSAAASAPAPDSSAPASQPDDPSEAPEFERSQTEYVAATPQPPPSAYEPPTSALPQPPASSEFSPYARDGGEYESFSGPPPVFPAMIPPGRDAGAGRPRRAGVAVVAAALVAALVGGGTGALIEHQLTKDAKVVNSLETPPLSGAKASNAPTGSVEQVAQTLLPSVVSITVSAGGQGDEGTGVILSSDGLVLTNNHVVSAAANGGRVSVTFHDGKSAAAEIVGLDPTSDLAVIRAKDVKDIQPAALGRSSDLAVGQQVVAIGSPLGLSSTVTSGIVSALGRPVRTGDDVDQQGRATVIDAIQTDAAINPGNSGGPLVNLKGQVVGINSAIATVGSSGQGGQSGNIGVGFAIPIDQARPIATQLVDKGSAEHAQLGVRVGPADGEQAGAKVEVIDANSAAAKAGLRTGDVITKVDGRNIDSSDALVAAVRSHQPGDKVTLTYLRDNSPGVAVVTLGKQ